MEGRGAAPEELGFGAVLLEADETAGLRGGSSPDGGAALVRSERGFLPLLLRASLFASASIAATTRYGASLASDRARAKREWREIPVELEFQIGRAHV